MEGSIPSTMKIHSTLKKVGSQSRWPRNYPAAPAAPIQGPLALGKPRHPIDYSSICSMRTHALQKNPLSVHQTTSQSHLLSDPAHTDRQSAQNLQVNWEGRPYLDLPHPNPCKHHPGEGHPTNAQLKPFAHLQALFKPFPAYPVSLLLGPHNADKVAHGAAILACNQRLPGSASLPSEIPTRSQPSSPCAAPLVSLLKMH